jgi:hypothetical protein
MSRIESMNLSPINSPGDPPKATTRHHSPMAYRRRSPSNSPTSKHLLPPLQFPSLGTHPMMSTQRRMRGGSRRVAAAAPAPPPDDARCEYGAVMTALRLQAAPTTAAPTRPPTRSPPADEAAMRAVLQAVITSGGKRAKTAAAAAGAPALVAVPEPLVDRVRVNNILHRMRTVRAALAPFRPIARKAARHLKFRSRCAKASAECRPLTIYRRLRLMRRCFCVGGHG